MGTRQSGPIGRPRGFDADEALERAMLVFWEHGYEGASLARLTGAMGISTTSMYAAFGNKEELFRKALERYTEGPGGYLSRALEEPTALGVATAILAGTVRTTTRPTRPHGCLGVQGALATSDPGRGVRDLLADWRNNGCSRLRERFQRAVDEGELPPGADPGLLARYVTTLAFGIAVQAASGVAREELQETADAALRNWPLT
ncbi:TetR/AcrR family transcriptional regulator [Streptomyces fenghuangensis]|uniref:TetR/AcrR family transcriptional regulator n=1 Tax=Streptomyces chitinivorans TaxID=1257027 RepID=A0ABW7HTV8_9ACTN|nr:MULTISPECIES: TetR/AcrR family transcriptional regulator [Streptomyces]MCG3041254.1 TetR/AcrR family transcriptional regulator [Streptomyces sp. ICN903]MDH2409796.1 TetR/AcrR family transcriptional regulator [Streptomyces chitinivorans]